MSMLISEPTTHKTPPVKRKRGRPPKANKPEDSFPTFTMQFESLPLDGSPNAELVSSQVVRSGEPDSFTPVMKVRPSPLRKKQKKSSNFSLPLDSPRFPRIDELLDDSRLYIASLRGTTLRTRVLDNLSLIINSPSHHSSSINTSPESVLRPGFVHLHIDFGNSRTPQFTVPEKRLTLDDMAITSREFHKETRYHASEPSTISTQFWNRKSHSELAGNSDLFGFELVIDETGQAVLADRRILAESSRDAATLVENSGECEPHFLGMSLALSQESYGTDETFYLPVSSHTDHREQKEADFDFDVYKNCNFTHDVSFKIDNSNNHAVIKQNGSLGLDSSIYQMMEVPSSNPRKSGGSTEQFSAPPRELMSHPFRDQDFCEKFPMGILNRMFDETNLDSPLERADARVALRKVFRKKERH